VLSCFTHQVYIEGKIVDGGNLKCQQFLMIIFCPLIKGLSSPRSEKISFGSFSSIM